VVAVGLEAVLSVFRDISPPSSTSFGHRSRKYAISRSALARLNTQEKVIPGNWLRPRGHVTPGGLPELMEDFISGVLSGRRPRAVEVARGPAALMRCPRTQPGGPVTYKRQGKKTKTIPATSSIRAAGDVPAALSQDVADNVVTHQPSCSYSPCHGFISIVDQYQAYINGTYLPGQWKRIAVLVRRRGRFACQACGRVHTSTKLFLINTFGSKCK
jgi:hypothetical protein